MDYINHITLNTGHIKKTYPGEVDNGLYFTLKRIHKGMFERKVEILEGYTVQGTNDPNEGILITVYDPHEIPILTTGITMHKGSVIWELLHSTAYPDLPLKTNPQFPPQVPYIADRLEIGALANMNALAWTGNFSKCMGWICLAPEKIR